MRLVGLCERFGVRAPIPYVQAAILNLRHPYIVIATAITDICMDVRPVFKLLSMFSKLQLYRERYVQT